MSAPRSFREESMHIDKKDPKESVRDFVIRVLKEKIVTLALEPGSMVSETELGAEMGVSRTPVREALIELTKIGIVQVFPQRGNMISRIDYRHVEEARFMRLVMENAVVELACDMATPEDILALENNIRLQRFYLENPDPDTLHALDDDFHRLLFSVSGKELTYQLIFSMGTHFNRVRRMRLSTSRELQIVEDHATIVQAIRNRDRTRARELMTMHLSRYKIDEADLRERYPNYFVD